VKLFWLLKGKVWKKEEIKTETKITREEKCVQLLRYFKQNGNLSSKSTIDFPAYRLYARNFRSSRKGILTHE